MLNTVLQYPAKSLNVLKVHDCWSIYVKPYTTFYNLSSILTINCIVCEKTNTYFTYLFISVETVRLFECSFIYGITVSVVTVDDLWSGQVCFICQTCHIELVDKGEVSYFHINQQRHFSFKYCIDTSETIKISQKCITC